MTQTRRWIDVPGAPAIPGLRFRLYSGEEDIAAMLAVANGSNAANGYLCGWTDPVFTRRAWRRRGLASALLGRSLQQLKDRGMTSAQLGLDARNENQALVLYQGHRHVVACSASEWHKPLEL